MEAASSFTSALFEIFANFVLAIAFKKVIATEQKLPSVSTANGTIDALEREPLARAFSWLLLYFCNFNFEAWKMWLLNIYIKNSLTYKLMILFTHTVLYSIYICIIITRNNN